MEEKNKINIKTRVYTSFGENFFFREGHPGINEESGHRQLEEEEGVVVGSVREF